MVETRHKIFVIQPPDQASGAVYELVRAAAAVASVDVVRVDYSIRERSLMEDVSVGVKSAVLIIADITRSNPNVMFEVGFAQALGKPLLLIASSSRSIPFDLSGVRVVIYDVTIPNEFVDRLAKSISEALKNPQAFLFTPSRAQKVRPSLFISYSHSDRDYLDRLLVHLRPLEKAGLIDLWVDTRLLAGDRWKREIEKALQRATVAVLLVSADFLASDFITDNELPPLLKDAEEKGTRILPLIVKPCRFTRDKNLRHFQAINDPRHSLALLPTGEQEVLYDRLAAEVEKHLQPE